LRDIDPGHEGLSVPAGSAFAATVASGVARCIFREANPFHPRLRILRRRTPRTAAISVTRHAFVSAAAPDPIAALRDQLPGIAAAATIEDQDSAFPTGSLASLQEAGLLLAPVHSSLGGLG
jgi:hypothetical protein